jgi:hypothetical protein
MTEPRSLTELVKELHEIAKMIAEPAGDTETGKVLIEAGEILVELTDALQAVTFVAKGAASDAWGDDPPKEVVTAETLLLLLGRGEEE